nr:MAG TPA: hypothetical protein [Caudoviricetes sp.]
MLDQTNKTICLLAKYRHQKYLRVLTLVYLHNL